MKVDLSEDEIDTVTSALAYFQDNVNQPKDGYEHLEALRLRLLGLRNAGQGQDDGRQAAESH